MARKIITVQAHHNYMDSVELLAANLKDAGLIVTDEIKPIGHFRGTVEESEINKIKSLPGVSTVNIVGDEGGIEPDEYTINQ